MVQNRHSCSGRLIGNCMLQWQWHQTSTISKLPCGIICMMTSLAILIKDCFQKDEQTDGQMQGNSTYCANRSLHCEKHFLRSSITISKQTAIFTECHGRRVNIVTIELLSTSTIEFVQLYILLFAHCTMIQKREHTKFILQLEDGLKAHVSVKPKSNHCMIHVHMTNSHVTSYSARRS